MFDRNFVQESKNAELFVQLSREKSKALEAQKHQPHIRNRSNAGTVNEEEEEFRHDY